VRRPLPAPLRKAPASRRRVGPVSAGSAVRVRQPTVPSEKDENVARAASMRCRRVGGPGSARCSSRTGESPSSRSAHHAVWAQSTRPTGGRDEHAGPCPAAVRDDSLAVALSSRTPPGLGGVRIRRMWAG
jgi:hypothetical protein